eukprot:scaffold17044_cov59-Phaeocystis_antarctica.AAC.3
MQCQCSTHAVHLCMRKPRLQLVQPDLPRAVLVEGVEEHVQHVLRRLDANHGHRLVPLAPVDGAVTWMVRGSGIGDFGGG